MSVWNSFTIAFSMYSKIPMPRAAWTEENRRFVMAFFPFVGLVISVLEWVWFLLSMRFGFGMFLRGAVAVVIPVLVTGGIHIDGFLDVCDSVSSRQSREKKLEILKDPHVGAFAVIGACVYFLLAFAATTELGETSLPLVIMIFPLSRCFSALGVLLLPRVSPESSTAAFSDDSSRLANLIIILAAITAILVRLFLGSPLVTVFLLLGLFVAVLYTLYLVRFVYGGYSGDIAGHFVCVAELAMLLAAVAAEWIGRALR